MTDDRAVIKEPVLTISTDIWVSSWKSKFPVQVSSSKFKLKIHTEDASKPLENWKFSNQTHHEPQRINRNLTQQKRSMSEKPSRNDEYDNIIFHVDNQNQEWLFQSHNMHTHTCYMEIMHLAELCTLVNKPSSASTGGSDLKY